MVSYDQILFKSKVKTNLILNKSSKRQIIKQICKVLPNICISIFSQAFIIEAIAGMKLNKLNELFVLIKNQRERKL